MPKRLRVFAGPNGSGKSTIEALVSSKYNIGTFVNADVIEKTLRQNKVISLASYGIHLKQSELTRALHSSGFGQKQDLTKLNAHLSLRSSILRLKETNISYSYLGAILSELIRNKMLEGRNTFSFETVMSHPSKIRFLEQAKNRGFKTYLYFISTESPEINIGRIQSRVAQGGHDVPIEKVSSRYYRSLTLLAEAVKIVDRAFIYDNSGEETILLAEKNDNQITIFPREVPKWFDTYVIRKTR